MTLTMLTYTIITSSNKTKLRQTECIKRDEMKAFKDLSVIKIDLICGK